MTPPRDPRLSAFFSPILDPTTEPDSGPLEARLDESDHAFQRDVFRSQRAIRFLVVCVSALGAALALPFDGSRSLILLAAGLSYGVLLWALPAFLNDAAPRGARSMRWLPPAVVASDLAAVAAIFGLAAPPGLAHRFLIAATLVVWSAGFYFRWQLAGGAAVVSVVVYAAVAGIPLGAEGAANVVIFGTVAAALTLELARFRLRVAQLRSFCRQVGDGDVGLKLALTGSQAPDEISALGRAIDSMRRRLAEQIGVDALTGCLNRRALESRLRGEWRLAKRRDSMVGVLALDMDHFKEINDIHGHPMGDTVLQQFAGIVRGVARESDVVARLGGDEFIVVLPDTDAEGTTILAERLRERVAEFDFGTYQKPIKLTISVGVALARGSNEITPIEILGEADRALYQSKESGRNRVSLRR